MVLRVETPYYVVGEIGLNVKETVVVTRTGSQPTNRSHRALVVPRLARRARPGSAPARRRTATFLRAQSSSAR